ncbi:MAG TPA: hydroxysqualene dehydroxylase HpnE [Rhodocyclaceae bacterium]|nr:hydroxysqualene dehydroxylase HpnE [Rhodocyclaceae bacterium]
MRIAVVGGGWAGIAAAVELAGEGHSVTLFEAGRRLGGRARSVDIDGRTLDNGQHILLGAYRDTLALMRRVGADPDALFLRLPLEIHDNAGFRMALPRLPAPMNTAWGLITAKGAGLGEKISTALWMDRLKADHFRLARDMTVAEWLDAGRQNGRLRRHLWEPLCLAALNTPPHRASAQIFANVLRDSLGSPRREDTDLLLPRADLGKLLPDPAAAWLAARGNDLRLGHRVRAIDTRESGIAIDGEPFDAAILATAPRHTSQLLSSFATEYEFEPIATVYLAYPADTRLDFPLRNLQGGIGQWVVDRGDGLLACVLSGHGEWEALTDDALATRLHAELGLDAAPTWRQVIREKRATFSCRPGLPRPGHVTQHPRLFLAGDLTWAEFPATLEGAVRSGLRAAKAVLAA